MNDYLPCIFICSPDPRCFCVFQFRVSPKLKIRFKRFAIFRYLVFCKMQTIEGKHNTVNTSKSVGAHNSH